MQPNSGSFVLFSFVSFFYGSGIVQQPDVRFDIEPFLKIWGFLKLRNTENLTATNDEVPPGDGDHGQRPRHPVVRPYK